MKLPIKTKAQLIEENKQLRSKLALLTQPTKKPIIDEDQDTIIILEMIAIGKPATDVYDAIAFKYEKRHLGLRCSMLELYDNKLMHGGAPSLPKEYCNAVHGLENGSSVGSCGTSTFTGKRVVVEDIATDIKWEKIKHLALPHGMRSCWSEPVKSSTGKVLGAFGMYYDHPALPNEQESNDLKSAARLTSIVMERDQSQKRILELAYTDQLTGLASRAHFYLHLEKLLKTSQYLNQLFSILYLDLDNFKSVNDTLGHDAGDLLLKGIADRLLLANSETDFIARLSGDEFSIIINEVRSDDYVAKIAQRCLNEIEKPIDILGIVITPSCSIGISHYPDDATNLKNILKAADMALYEAKDSGKNRYAFYKPELTIKAEYRFQLENALREAIIKKQLTLVYQPQINLKNGVMTGVEVLSRWHHPQLGQVSPVDFIATAERIGMIKSLTEWVLNTACHQAIEWRKVGLPALRIAVNISPNHFLDETLILMINEILNKTGLTPSNLELEVTEDIVHTNPLNLVVFKNLKELGILLSLDDFGAGYSSFASLKHLQVDCLKIDQYFINDMVKDKRSHHLVNSMIEISHNLQHMVIAEGVETKAQVNLLKSMKCEVAQGYFYSKPLTADALKAFHLAQL